MSKSSCAGISSLTLIRTGNFAFLRRCCACHRARDKTARSAICTKSKYPNAPVSTETELTVMAVGACALSSAKTGIAININGKIVKGGISLVKFDIVNL